MRVNCLINKIAWFGKYSGYECLPNYLKDRDVQVHNYQSLRIFKNKLIGKLYQKWYKWTHESPEQVWNQIRFLRDLKKADIAHLLYLEGNIHILDCLKEVPANLLGTIHLPFDKWPQAKLDCLHRLKNAIILYEEDIPKFQTYMNNGNITFIRHGVDLDFFKPDDKVPVNKNKVLFVGHYLRDFDMMVEVYRSITDTVSNKIEFHFVLAEHFRDTNAIKYLLQQPNVTFHANLSDEELLQQYQSSYVMLMPLASSGANTAIVQGLAIGLPIITNDIGGIRSYGGGDVFEIAPNNDAGALVQLFKKYYADEKFRDSISAAQRRFSVECLDWRISAAQHLSLYKSLVK